MRFHLLGPLEVHADGGEPVVLSAAKQRTLLVVLLLHADRPVGTDRLVEALWPGVPPPSAAANVRTYVAQLRGALRRTSRDHPPALTLQPGGYRLAIRPLDLDLLIFEDLVARGRQALAGGDPATAAGLLRDALALWRGRPAEDVAVDGEAANLLAGLAERHVSAQEAWNDARLASGGGADLITGLRGLVDRYPLRERFHAQLITALAGTGRRGDALEAYRHARRVLVEELGVEPGPELQDLHQRVLAGDTDRLAPSATAAATVPRQLPAGVGHFVGRTGELKALSALLTRQGGAGGAVVISAIGGMAGIGKTALAVHWAHRVADRFPDGQLYVNLRGFDPSGTPMAPAEAVRGLLDALGVPAGRIPADPGEQTALYRSESADRRMLIVLDNARTVEQVRPLLPGAPGCLVVVTSRDQLGGLVALDGAVPLTLNPLTGGEARDLLIRRLGRERVAADERAVADLIEACARLPLALNIVAARAALHPGRPLAEFADELRDTRRRLDTLSIGRGAADVRAVFSWSYRTLDPDTAHAFRLLGLHPGPDISLPAAAGLTALDPADARRALDHLTTAHLLTEHTSGRYGLHDLLRAYAAEQTHTHDTEPERDAALRRLCDFYLHTAHAADRLLYPHRVPIRLDPPTPGTTLRPPADDSAALDWFEAEHRNLIAAQQTATTHAWHSTVWQLAWTMVTFHQRRAHCYERLLVWHAALEAAEHLREPAMRAAAHRNLGIAHIDLGHSEEATGHLHQVLTLTADRRDPAGEGDTHAMLAQVWHLRGDGRRALHHATRALDLYRTVDRPVREAEALNDLGWFTAHVGDYETARAHCRAALALHRRHHNTDGAADTLDSLGYVEHQIGQYQQAIEYYQQALELYRGTGNTYNAASTLDHLGHSYSALGRHEQARAVWREALELYRAQRRDTDAERVQGQLDALGLA